MLDRLVGRVGGVGPAGLGAAAKLRHTRGHHQRPVRLRRERAAPHAHHGCRGRAPRQARTHF